MKNRNYLSAGLLLVPLACAVFASLRYNYGVHAAIPVACAVLVGCLSPKQISRTKWLLIAAFAFSIAGDWMLKHRGGDVLMFVYGIALFFVAHVGFLAFCLKNGKIQWALLGLLAAGYGMFFAWKLLPAIPDAVLLTAVGFYVLISCLSLAAAPGLRLPFHARWLFTAGIACIVFSDTLIACCEFLDMCGLYRLLMMPTYYAAHILVAAAVILPSPAYKNSKIQ
ncbi:MAG: lysoplasmalogenase [Tannerella sp.]|nr:lysoplasmalogenase [Tannerella sp.]